MTNGPTFYKPDRKVVVGERLQVVVVFVVLVVVIVCLLLILVDCCCLTDATIRANVKQPLVLTTLRHGSDHRNRRTRERENNNSASRTWWTDRGDQT